MGCASGQPPRSVDAIAIIRAIASDVADAKKKLSKLIKAVGNGEAVRMGRDDVPTVELVHATDAASLEQRNLEPGNSKSR
jgi:antitoxin (DNA-binding transcriptional repressor) of toxin-antitoxin stability system